MTSEKGQYDILVIEDNLPTIHLLRAYFKSEGFKSKCVISGTKGLEELKRELPKVILLDLTLPDLDWYDVAKKIKANKSSKDIPLYVFGEITKIDVLDKVEELGAVGVIPKPFCFNDFKVIFELASKTVIHDLTLWEFDDDEP